MASTLLLAVLPASLDRTTYIWATAIILTISLWKVLGILLYNYSRRTTTVLDDLAALGTPNKGGKLKGTALVAGGRCVCSSLL
jgi:hypothetical protein